VCIVGRPLDRRQLLVVAGLAVTPVNTVDAQQATDDVHATTSALLDQVIASYEYSDLSDIATRLRPLELTTRRVPAARRLRGRPATDWMRLHARVMTVLAGCAYDRGNHTTAATWADRAVTMARAAGDDPLAARALTVRARIVRCTSPSTALHVAAQAYRLAGRGPAAAMIAGKVIAGTCARMGDLDGTHAAVRHAWRIMDGLDDSLRCRPGFDLDGYHSADLSIACAEALSEAGAPEAAVPYLERAGVEIEMSGPPGMLSSVRMAQARMALAGARPDPDEADTRTTEAIVASAGRPTEWLARLVRDIADQASTYGHDMGDLVDATFGWQPRPDLT
jgi:hypothetical protein